MSKKKKTAKISSRDKRSLSQVKDALKTVEKLELQLSKVKKYLEMPPPYGWECEGPHYGVPPK